MEQDHRQYNVHSGSNMVDSYFYLIQNLSEEDKIALIARISNSIIQDKRKDKKKRSKEQILAETYGCFESEKSADEIIEEIHKSRHFINKNHQL